ncbi:DUF3869 domain-containing protein [Bacteroides helcogenes]|uniref:DUF3869 domain-containing protein n=1 Tax=Bacteroides helcogenes (strain ATCC 35417 / DSM 20613 / JCM 6297 / CCUG 15421 / P 36-108) TaxID=693979 RepID=E6SNP5_BACT6|nr:DUF3869 domain-containing protein [Bacteroides helcogenes]ADV44778.1 hypothetical protein Bache_2842 [Bacteroides helcogenes P 36-108]MDY5239988.1 DUF3869 domain-containing protein [Bacteroides helcogenes]
MRKVNFLSSLNTKLVLAVSVVAGFALTGCTKEDFNVNVPNINVTVPEVTIPEAEAGVAYVNLSATSANGNTLDGVVFTDETGAALEASVAYKAAATFKVYASKDGYTTVVKTVNVPALQKGAYVVIPVNFVLEAVAEDVAVENGEKLSEEPIISDPVEQVFTGEFAAGTVIVKEVPVPVGGYVTPEQKAALLSEVDALTGPDTRATLSDEEKANLMTAQGLLRDKINALPTTAKTGLQSIAFTLTEAASSVTFNVTTQLEIYAAKLTAIVADKSYSVTGEQTIPAASSIEATAEGVAIDHSHGHGDSTNAGGGIGGK